MERELVIGALALQEKDAAVLRVLVRLLDGSMSQCLRFSEQLAACNIVFAPPGHGADLASVVVAVTEKSETPAGQDTIAVPTPLRMSNVMGALHAALARLHPPARADQTQGLLALFHSLRECLVPSQPERSVIPLESGHLVLVHAAEQRLQTAAPIELLLAGHGLPQARRDASLLDEERLRSAPSHALRDVVWRLTRRLVEVGAVAPDLPGAWRLRRWPEAAGLTTPGHPRLAALLTARPHTVAGLVAASGLPTLTVQWFIASCRFFDLVELSADAPPPAVQAAAVPGWFGHLRQKLRLW